jgi:hypothetical protein
MPEKILSRIGITGYIRLSAKFGGDAFANFPESGILSIEGSGILRTRRVQSPAARFSGRDRPRRKKKAEI